MMQYSVKQRVVATSALLALTALGLAGCSGSSQPTSGAATADGNSTSAPSDGKVEIKYMHRLPDGEGMTKVADITKKWNEANPDIQVTAIKFNGSGDDMWKKLEADVRAGNSPCLAQLGYAEVPELFTKGMLMDVTQYATQYQDKFSQANMDQMELGGKYVGIPQDSGPLIYLYNKAEFDKLGIAVPTTIDEYLAAAEKAAASGKYIADWEPDQAIKTLSAQSAAADGPWYAVEGDKWKVQVKNPGTQKVAAMWQQLLDKKATLTNNRWDDAFKKDIADGKLIGFIAAAWEPALIASDFSSTPQKGQWRVAQLFDMGAGMHSGPHGGSGVAVMKGCEYPEQAMKFNAWFNQQVQDLATQGLVPAAKEQADTPQIQSEFYGGQNIYEVFHAANESMIPMQYIPGFYTANAEIGKLASEIADGQHKVDALFETAQQASLRALKDLNLPVVE